MVAATRASSQHSDRLGVVDSHDGVGERAACGLVDFGGVRLLQVVLRCGAQILDGPRERRVIGQPGELHAAAGRLYGAGQARNSITCSVQQCAERSCGKDLVGLLATTGLAQTHDDVALDVTHSLRAPDRLGEALALLAGDRGGAEEARANDAPFLFGSVFR